MIIGSNFRLNSRRFLDARQQCESLEKLNANEESILYPYGFEVFCVEEGKWYQNVSEDNTPIWEQRKGGVGGSNGEINIDDIIEDGEVLSDKTWSSEYINGFKINLEQSIIDTEDYVAEIEDRVVYIEGQLQWFETFDGSYNSLTDKPIIPSKISDLENDSNFVTTDDVSEVIDALHTHENLEILNGITEEKISLWDNMVGSAFNGDYNFLENKPIEYIGDDSEIKLNLNNITSGNYIITNTIDDIQLINELVIIDKKENELLIVIPKLLIKIIYILNNGEWVKQEKINYQVDKDNANISNSLNIGANNIVGENNQIVQGKYNVEDTEGKYINIVGNGEDENNRKNIHTLDWEGNAWYNGKVSQEGVPTEDKDLVTKGYVDGKFATSERVEKYIEDNNKENARRDVIIDALANGRRRTIDYVDGETDLFYATEKDDIFIDKIEGETLVNVCDQEEPIAITKSYTVENTNHVALQGEYDGKCRPVVYGNTLVNRNVEHNKSMVIGNAINESGTEVNITGVVNSEVEVSLDGHTALNLGTKKGGELCKSFESASGNEIKLTTDRNSKTDVVCQGDTLVNLFSASGANIDGSFIDNVFIAVSNNTQYSCNLHTTNVNLFKPSTTYTIVVDVLKCTLADDSSYVLLSHSGTTDTQDIFSKQEGNLRLEKTIGRQIYVRTTIDDFTGIRYATRSFLVNTSLTEGQEISYRIQIFEGDLTQTPELIPTKYVEGIQSTFEDKYIPYSIYNGDSLTSITETQYQLPLTVKTNTTYTVVTTMNTTKYQYAIYSQDSLSEYLAYENTLSTAIFSSDKANISFKVRMNPSYEGEDYNFVLDEVKDKFLIVEGNFSGRENLLTSEYFGKYKVDMSSVGKNLFDKNKTIKKYISEAYTSDTTTISPTDVVLGNADYENLTSDYIKVKPNTTYTFSITNHTPTLDDWIGWAYFRKKQNTDNYARIESIDGRHTSNVSSVTFTTPSDTEYLLIGGRYLQQKNAVAQLEEGIVATEYEPYCGSTKTVYLNSPLYKGDELLTKDGKIYHYHKMGSVVLDGSEDTWTNSLYLSDNVIRFYTTMSRGISKKNTVLYCDRFRYDGVYENYKSYESELIHHDQDFNFAIYKSKLSTTDVNGFKQWLQENPVTLVYELAEPWYEPLGEYGKVVLDGSEEIIQHELNNNANYRTYLIPFSNIKIKGKCYADKIKTTDGFNVSTVNEPLICCSSESSRLAISSNITTLNNFKQWLQQNPITVIYELENPQPIDDDMIFDIATSSTLSYESAVPMGTTSFLPYTNELPLLETSTQYRVSFDCDIVGLPLVVSLGGTTTTITSELHNTLSIITPSIETNGKLTIDGSGIANIDNVVVTKGEMVYEYFEGLKSSFENTLIPSNYNNLNLFDYNKMTITEAGKVENGYLIYDSQINMNNRYSGYYCKDFSKFEVSTEYMVIVDIIESNMKDTDCILYVRSNASEQNGDPDIMESSSGEICNIDVGRHIFIYKTLSNFDLSKYVLRTLIYNPNFIKNLYCKFKITIYKKKYYTTLTLKTNDDNIIFGKGGRL